MEHDESICGHTDEEHQQQLQEILYELLQGNISVLMTRLTNDNLEAALQAAVTEVFVRSPTIEAATENWDRLDDLMRRTYLVDYAEESATPEFWEIIEGRRSQFSQDIARWDFHEEATAGLAELFEGGLDDEG